MEKRQFHKERSDRQGGFNLITLSILLTVAALVLVSRLPGNQAGDTLKKAQTTVEKLQKVEQAMTGFMARNGRRPCPADGQYDTNNANFGVEAANAGTCTGGTPAADFSASSQVMTGNTTYASAAVTSIGSTTGLTPGMSVTGSGIPSNSYIVSVDSSSQITLNATATATAAGVSLTITNQAVAGVIPTRSLALDDSYALDEWGHRITYVVDKRATLNSSCLTLGNYPTANGKGGIAIESSTGGTVLDNTMVAYVSHGPDGHGAFPAQGSNVANRINIGSTDTDQLTNAGVNSNFVTNFTNIKVQKDKTSTFDDIVYYADYQKNLCCVGTVACTRTGLRFDDTATGDEAGYAVAMGDINGDGIPDLILGAPYATANGLGNAGQVYVIFGQKGASWPADPISLITGSGNIIDGTRGIRFDGESNFDRLGRSLAVGDVNGDGIKDLVIGSLRIDAAGHTTGSVYVVYGKTSGWSSTQTLNAAYFNTGSPAAQGFRLDGEGINPDGASDDYFGANVAVTDVNGDGKADIIAGTAFVTSPGSVYVVYGGSATPSTTVTTNGTTSVTAASYSRLVVGQTVTAANIPSGTTIKDCGIGGSPAIGTPCGSTSLTLSAAATSTVGAPGEAFTVITSPTNCTFLSSAACTGSGSAATGNAAYGYRLDGVVGSDMGASGLAGGNVTGHGDAKNDIIIGQAYNGLGNGQVYVVYGKAAGTWTTPQTLGTAFFNTGGSAANGFELDGTANDFYVGWSVSLGDINGDGMQDIIIGADGSKNSYTAAGSVYVVYGGAKRQDGTAWSTPLTLSTAFLNGTGTAVNGFRLDGEAAQDHTGVSVAAADVNGDGYADIIATGYLVPGSSTGTSTYVVYGKSSGWAVSQTLNSTFLNTGGTAANGFRLDGDAAEVNNIYDNHFVAGGDLTGDGKADIVIGASDATVSVHANAGSVYLVFGKKSGWTTPITLDSYIW